MITVFTPAYNRGHLLPRLYESLCRQTFKDFEWVVVDDGSSDDTRSVVEKFSVSGFELSGDKAQPFNPQPSTLNPDFKTQNSKLKTNSIRYFYQENGGKHRAINRGVREARGDIFFIVDSDDFLFPDSLEAIAEEFKQIKDDESFCGVSGMRGYSATEKIGTPVKFDHIDCTIMESSYKYHIYGDKAEAFKTDVLRRFPFPEYEGEKFCPEALVLNRISKYYKIRYFDKIIYQCEYLPDGLTSKISRLLECNVKSTMVAYKEMNEFADVPLWFRIRSAINYYRYTMLKSFKYSDEFRLKQYWIWTLPLGIILRLIKG